MDNRNIQAACTKVGMLLADLINDEPKGVEKIAGTVAVSMAALTVAASVVMDGFNPDTDKIPTEDHILFAALLVWGSCHLDTSGRLGVTVSPEMITDTMDHFKKFTGQNARPLLNKSMMKVIDAATKVDTSSFGENSKFLPH